MDANELNNLALNLGSKGDIEQSKKTFLKALKIEPEHIQSLLNLGILLTNSGLPKQASVYLNKVASLKRITNPEYLFKIGQELEKCGLNSKAIKTYQRILKLDPLHSSSWYQMGILYNLANDKPKALRCFKKLVQINPQSPDAISTLAHFYDNHRRYKDSSKLYQRLLQSDPNNYEILGDLYLSRRNACHWQDLSKLENKLDQAEFENPLLSIIRSEDPQKNLSVAKKISSAIDANATNKFTHPVNKGQKPKIRLGYLSCDFRDHPIGQMTSGIFDLHDRNQFEVIAYSYGLNDRSRYRERVEKTIDKFVDLAFVPDQLAAHIIFNDQLDILIDISGYTTNARPGILALRPAPIQVNYLGFPGATGASFYDYILADEIIIPLSDQKYYSEKVVYFSRCYQVNDNKQKISNKKFKRSDFGLPAKGFVFSSFVQNFKLDPGTFSLWMDLLQEVPDSIIWLWDQGIEAKHNLWKFAEKKGIAKSRIIFSKTLPKPEHLKRLSLSDLALDTKIYGGHTTTTDYLFAGVPVITQLGSHFASRVCASILTEVGLSNFIINSQQKYKELAIKLANSPGELIRYKQLINRKSLMKNLFNTKRFVKDLEKILVNIYHQ